MLTLLPPPPARGGRRPGAGRKPLPIGGPRDQKVLAEAQKLASADAIAELFVFAQRGNLGALRKLNALFERARAQILATEGKRATRRKASDDTQAALFE